MSVIDHVCIPTAKQRCRLPLSCALGASYAAMLSLAIASNLISLFLTTLRTGLSSSALNNEHLGRIGAVTFAGLVAAIVLTGSLADRLGAKTFAIVGNLLVTAGLVILGTASGYRQVLSGACVMGVGAGMLDMVLSPIVCALQPERRIAAMNVLHAFYGIGAVSTILIAATALRMGLAWRTVTLFLAILPILAASAFVAVRIPPLIPGSQQRSRLRDLCRNRSFLLSLAICFFAGATELGMTQWLPAYAERGLHCSRWSGGMNLLGFFIAITLGRIAAALGSSRIRPDSLMMSCCGLTVGLVVAGCFVSSAAVALSACMAAGLAIGCLWPSTLALVADRFVGGGAPMFALLTAFANLGGVFMPWVIGIVADATTMNWALLTVSSCPAAIFVVLLWTRPYALGRVAESDGRHDAILPS